MRNGTGTEAAVTEDTMTMKNEEYPYRQFVLQAVTVFTLAMGKRWGGIIVIPMAIAAMAGAKYLPPPVIERLLFPKARRSDWTHDLSRKIGDLGPL